MCLFLYFILADVTPAKTPAYSKYLSDGGTYTVAAANPGNVTWTRVVTHKQEGCACRCRIARPSATSPQHSCSTEASFKGLRLKLKESLQCNYRIERGHKGREEGIFLNVCRLLRGLTAREVRPWRSDLMSNFLRPASTGISWHTYPV